jgi:hypothetical protein
MNIFKNYLMFFLRIKTLKILSVQGYEGVGFPHIKITNLPVFLYIYMKII